jgi:hypothetical protein
METALCLSSIAGGCSFEALVGQRLLQHPQIGWRTGDETVCQISWPIILIMAITMEYEAYDLIH